jgi:hypothetical protein
MAGTAHRGSGGCVLSVLGTAGMNVPRGRWGREDGQFGLPVLPIV